MRSETEKMTGNVRSLRPTGLQRPAGAAGLLMPTFASIVATALLAFTLSLAWHPVAYAESGAESLIERVMSAIHVEDAGETYLSHENPLDGGDAEPAEIDSAEFHRNVDAYADVSEALTRDEAVEQLKQAMAERRIDPIVVTVEYDGRPTNDAFSLVSDAFGEDGDPTHGDYLRWVYDRMSSSARNRIVGSRCYTTYAFSITYKTSAEQEAATLAAAKTALAGLHIARGMNSDEAKVRAIYDYLCEHVTYDYAHLGDSGYRLQFTAYAAIVDKTAVCQGYSSLLYLMARLEGVPVRMVVGTGNRSAHAWNIVKVGPWYYNVDSTWDAGNLERGMSYLYYLKSDADFKDHVRGTISNGIDYAGDEFYAMHPMAPTSYVAETQVIDGVTYTLRGDEMVATSLSKTADDVSIRSEVGGYPVTAVGNAFASMHNSITSVSLPDSVREIGRRAFNDCPCLSKVEFGSGVTKIGAEAFAGCWSLAGLELPSGLESIGDQAFYYCMCLKDVTLPVSVSHVGSEAFAMLAKESTVRVSSRCLHGSLSGNPSNYVTTERTEIAVAPNAKSHALVEAPGYPAACDRDGRKSSWTCSLCGKSFGNARATTTISPASLVIPSLGHEWDEGSVTKEPTCEQPGQRTFICKHDGSHARIETIPASGHSWGEWVVSTPAMCEKGGVEKRVCDNDPSHVESRDTKALGHDYAVEVVDPTTEAGGYTLHTCSRCGHSFKTDVTEPLKEAADDEGATGGGTGGSEPGAGEPAGGENGEDGEGRAAGEGNEGGAAGEGDEGREGGTGDESGAGGIDGKGGTSGVGDASGEGGEGDGQAEKPQQGNPEGNPEGSPEGNLEGGSEGNPEGNPEGGDSEGGDSEEGAAKDDSQAKESKDGVAKSDDPENPATKGDPSGEAASKEASDPAVTPGLGEDANPDKTPGSGKVPDSGETPNPDEAPASGETPDPGEASDQTVKPAPSTTAISSQNVNITFKATYTGWAHEPYVTVSVNGKPLVRDVDYAVACYDTRGRSVSASRLVDAGSYSVVVKGKGAYTGEVVRICKIKKAHAKGFLVSRIPSQNYRGKSVKPKPLASFEGERLELGSDYKLAYKNNSKPRTAKVVIKGVGNFKGKKVVKFKIEKPQSKRAGRSLSAARLA